MGKPDLHYSQLLRVDGERAGVRPFTIGEFGRLMGVPECYRMPPTVRQAAKLAGEGVAVPVVRWLAAHLLEPLDAAAHFADEVPAAAVERRRPERVRKQLNALPPPGSRLKQRTVGTTAYFLPEESARVHDLAASLEVSVHELIMRGLERMFMHRGFSPVRRIPRTSRPGRARRGGEVDITRMPSLQGRENRHGRFRPRTGDGVARLLASRGRAWSFAHVGYEPRRFLAFHSRQLAHNWASSKLGSGSTDPGESA